MRPARTTLAVLAPMLAGLAAGCDEASERVEAYRPDAPDELIGGIAAMAREGDVIVENDRIRIGITGEKASPGPGVFGGTLVDADLQRTDGRNRGGRGRDQFGEMFPFANLLMPRPAEMDVRIVEDGSDGERAVVRVEAEGAFFIDALKVFRNDTLQSFFPGTKTHLRLRTDYILEPGDRYVKMESTATQIPADESFECDRDCAAGYVFSDDGTPSCECAPEGPIDMPHFQSQEPLFDPLLGSREGEKAGIVAGDFVFFGGRNDIFAPGMGFDEERAVWSTVLQGRDPFTDPLPLDFVAAAGGPVSYGYFTKSAEGKPSPKILVPIITSSATAFATSSSNCSEDEADDASCDDKSSWSWERYFVVGGGDIGTVRDVVQEVRGTPTGEVRGVVRDEAGQPLENGRVFLFRDPDPERDFDDVHELVDANRRASGEPGLLNAVDADVGVPHGPLDRIEDGAFDATMPPGTYLAVATTPDRSTTSAVRRIEVEEGETTTYEPIVPSPARVSYRVTDGQGRLLPAKLTFVTLRAPSDDSDREDARPARGDARRKTYMGEGRLGQGIRTVDHTDSGKGTISLEPGRYRLYASHGPEYGRAERDITLRSGRERTLKLTVPREMDTSGWIAGDFHLHSEPSFDSGMELERRVRTAAAEGLDLAVSTDHDVVTDYQPAINELKLHDHLKTAIGVELTTVEMGHFIAFPLRYDDREVPDHGAPEWTCRSGPQILDSLMGRVRSDARGVSIMAHPRDGFIGYISQLDVSQFGELDRADYRGGKVSDDLLSGGSALKLEGGNPLFRVSTCAYDAMELFNAKRFDLLRTPTVAEVTRFMRCMRDIREVAQNDVQGLRQVCPELKPEGELFAPCDSDAPFFECRLRQWRGAALASTAEILTRTPAEQEAFWNFDPSEEEAPSCPAEDLDTSFDPEQGRQPCVAWPGTFDDWTRWLDRGLNVTVTAASDSHTAAREAGMPRTMVKSPASEPQDVRPDRVARNVADGHALPTYGPLVEVSVDGAGPGEVASVDPGEPFELDVRVQTASWFGVDRVEVYVSGEIQEVIELDHGPEPIVDLDRSVELTAPDGDGAVYVVAIGRDRENLLRPVYKDVPFGTLQLASVTREAFGGLSVPGSDLELGEFLGTAPEVPNFYPVFPLAVTNAVLLDGDGDGAWMAERPLPPFCPRECGGSDQSCPAAQQCVSPESRCGYAVGGSCTTGPPGTGLTHARQRLTSGADH